MIRYIRPNTWDECETPYFESRFEVTLLEPSKHYIWTCKVCGRMAISGDIVILFSIGYIP